MTTFILRHALESDAKSISDLIHLVGINPMGLDWSRFVVAVDTEGRLVGCGQIKPHGSEIRELASIAAHPDHRGKGIARSIIQQLLDENPRPLYLMCMSHNGGLYQKFGFRALQDEELPRYFSRIKKVFKLADVFRKTGEDLLVMKLE
jgi:N-acetylglutamate synthase-like GNAT family acetyltransferase